MDILKKLRWKAVGPVLLILLAALCLTSGLLNSSQAYKAYPLHLHLVGEYQQGGGDWQPLDAATRLSARQGDVTLRGRIDYDLPAPTEFCFFVNHIVVSIALDGESLLDFSYTELPDPPLSCGKGWEQVLLPPITSDTQIKITLHNPHRLGNINAYNDFLSSLYTTDLSTLENYLAPLTRPFDAMGWFMLIAGTMLIGAAAVCLALHTPLSAPLGRYGLLCLLAAAYLLSDTIGPSSVDRNIDFDSHLRCLSMLLAFWLMGVCASAELKGRPCRVARAAVWGMGALDGFIMLAALCGRLPLYDGCALWQLAQAVFCLVLVGCCIGALVARQGDPFVLIGYLFLSAASLLDMLGVGAAWYSQGTCTKVVFTLLVLLHLFRGAYSISINHRAAGQLQKMATELEDNRIAIMLSQIQPHFLYNSLTSIAQLCEKDPKKAKKTTIAFSEYLRHNMRSLSLREPLPFAAELEHVKTYLSIEQIRFGDRLHIVYEIGATDFMLPALTLQPIVENAVKHGVGMKRGGGTVTITTAETADAILLTVRDDGVGFDPAAPLSTERRHVGIENVRSRLAALSHGTLTVTSAPGEGTIAVIALPKGQRDNAKL